MPRMKKELNTEDMKIGQDKEVDIPVDGDVKVEAKPHETDIDTAKASKNLEKTSFFNEVLTVVVHESTDQNAEPIPMVGVNGRNQYFVRGRPQKVRRKFVAALARAKKTGYRQHVRIDEVSGNVVQRMMPATGLVYPFSVIDDPNPRGREWLQNILAEA